MRANTSPALLTPEGLSRQNSVASIEQAYDWASQTRLSIAKHDDTGRDVAAMGWETRTSTVCQTIFADDTDTD